MQSTRIKFTKKLLSEADKYKKKNVFVEFIILWIGLNALYDTGEKERENEKIRKFFESKTESVFKILRTKKQDLNLINQFINKTPQHTGLREFLRTRQSFLSLNNKDNSVKDFAEFLYQVRNNMFHAVKLWDEKTEVELLAKINPILRKLLMEITKI